MIWSIQESAAKMNGYKRPRNSNGYFPTNSEVIVLSDDDTEEHQRKRQKSLTPARPINDVRSAKADAAPVDSVSASQHEEFQKKSPWRNQPAWSKPSSSSTPLDSTSTQHTEDRFRRLSLTPVHQKPKYEPDSTALHYSPYGYAKELFMQEEKAPSQFKIASSAALRFNPNSNESLDPPDLASWKRQPVQQHAGSVPVSASQPTRQHRDSALSSVSRPRQTIQPEESYNNDNVAKLGPNVTVDVPVRPSPYASTPPPPPSIAPTSKDTKLSILVSDRPQQSPLNVSVNVPLTERAKFRKERKALQEKLKKSTEYAKAHPELVERYLGLTGFANEFSSKLNLNEEKYKNAAQSKMRKVDRSKISLYISETTQPLSGTHETPKFIHPKDQVKAILVARFSEHVNPPLTFSNNLNDRRLDGKFQFISEYILRKGVKTATSVNQPRCTCTSGCDSSCECLTKTFKDDKLQDRVERIPQYKVHKGHDDRTDRADRLVVLRNDFIKRHQIQTTTEADSHQSERVEISECNETCPCNPSNCINRVVQQGRTVPLEIFETERCGFGVRSPAPLARGQFIEVYLGEVITMNELERREAAAEEGSHSFVYSLDWFSSHQPYQIDGLNFGSAMRFVNHSCEPNAASFPVLNNKSTKQLHYNAFFATKDIPAGTEITIDYTPQAAGETYELKAADEGFEKCYCGSKNCRQMLWLPGKERRSRKKTRGKSFD